MTVVGRRPSAATRLAMSPEGGLRLYQVRFMDYWRFVWRQPLAFWFMNAYLFMEYVRPQSIYPWLAAFPWSQVFIIAAAVTALMKGQFNRRYITADIWMFIFSAIILIGCLTAYQPSRAFERLPIWLAWMVIYLIYTAIINTEERFVVITLAWILYNLKMSLHGTRSWAEIGFGFRDWGVSGAPGWFQNSGEFGIEMTMFLSISIYFFVALHRYWPKWKSLIVLGAPITAIMGGMGSSSRGAILGFGAVIGWMLMWSKYRVRALVVVAVLAFGVIFLLPEQQKVRFSQIGEDSSSTRRMTYWKDGLKIAAEHPVFGIGFENWLPYYRTFYMSRGQVSHNPFIQAVSELGYPGLFTYCMLIVMTLRTNWDTRKRAKKLGQHGRFIFFMGHGLDGALMGYLVSGFFVTVLYYPFFWINLAMTVSLNNIARSNVRKAKAEGTLAPVRTFKF